MALKATIFKTDLQISDLNRHYYKGHSLTIAQHPSETDERMMVRLLAFVINAHDRLHFSKGLSSDDEPAIWQKSLSDEIEIWIDVGLPDEKRIRKASGKSERVIIYSYGGNQANLWWKQIESKLTRLQNVSVFNIEEDHSRALAKLAQRTMQLNFTVQDDQVWIANQTSTVEVHLKTLKSSS